MSALTHNDIAEMVRRRFNGPDGDVLRYVPLVDSAIRHLAYDVAADPNLSHWLLTDPATTTAVLDANGVANLTALIANPRILLECLRYGEVMPPVNDSYPQLPLRMLDHEGQGMLKGIFDRLQGKYWLSGKFLHTKRISNAYMAGSISFETGYWPTLDQLPEALIHNLVHGNYWQVPIQKEAA